MGSTPDELDVLYHEPRLGADTEPSDGVVGPDVDIDALEEELVGGDTEQFLVEAVGRDELNVTVAVESELVAPRRDSAADLVLAGREDDEGTVADCVFDGPGRVRTTTRVRAEVGGINDVREGDAVPSCSRSGT